MKTFGVALALGLVGLLLVIFLAGWYGEGQAELRSEKATIALEQQRELAPLWLATKRVLVASLGVGGGSLALLLFVAGIVALLSTPNLVRTTWVRSWLIKPGRYGAQYPALAVPDGNGHIRIVDPVNEPGAQKVAALTTGLQPDVRLQGSAARAALKPQDEQYMLPEPAGPVELAPEQVIQPDPQNQPDTVVVGQKGSGKTNVLRYLIETYGRAMPDAEFLILSTIASNWGQIPAVTEPEHIHQAVLALRDELNRRDAAMQAAGVRDYHRWPDAPPKFVVIVDEAEAVADALKMTNRKTAAEFAGTLRIVVNTARNFGGMFVIGTQTARTDVLDPTFIRNAATLLMMRMDTSTAARFSVYGREITDVLPTLPRGRAYNPQHSGFVNFPLVRELGAPRMSGIYRPPLQLPADAEADGLGEDDLASGPADGSGTVLEPGERVVYAVEAPPVSGTVPVPTAREGSHRIPRRRPTPVEAAAMRAHYDRTHSKTAVCFRFYGWKNGACWEWVEQALRGEM